MDCCKEREELVSVDCDKFDLGRKVVDEVEADVCDDKDDDDDEDESSMLSDPSTGVEH